MDRSAALKLLRTAVGNDQADFRPGQWEAVDALVNRQGRLLVVQRTGWGKSLVYFISTRILRERHAGPTIIISPLLALMRNQIEAAQRLGLCAQTINSANHADWASIRRQILAGDVDAILVSPERLANEAFVQDVLLPVAAKVGLIVVDEAHCISDWGHDFRPDYRRLVGILQQLPPNLPLLCTTATANDRVIADISALLGRIDIQRGPLVRQSLVLQTLRLPDQPARLAWLAHYVPKLPGTGIIYTLTREDAERVAAWLDGHPDRRPGHPARAGHAHARAATALRRPGRRLPGRPGRPARALAGRAGNRRQHGAHLPGRAGGRATGHPPRDRRVAGAGLRGGGRRGALRPRRRCDRRLPALHAGGAGVQSERQVR